MITLQEIRNKFNLHYDNVISGGAPGLTPYEISLLLTQASREVIYNAYSGNSKGEAVDDTERGKSLLSGLTKSFTTTSIVLSDNPLTDNLVYSIVTLPESVWFLLKEHVVVNSKHIVVKPLTHNEFWVQIENPLRAPNNFRAWRLDEQFDDLTLNGQSPDPDIPPTPVQRQLLLVTNDTVTSYSGTCIEKQIPIILSTLPNNLTIEGVSSPSLPPVVQKNPWLADLIVNRAVELATRDYKNNTLESQIALNARVE